MRIKFYGVNHDSSYECQVIDKGYSLKFSFVHNENNSVTHYDIDGKRTDYYWDFESRAYPMYKCFYTKIDEEIIGKWIEEGHEYLFLIS